jgi:hypothetical protein
LALGEAALVGLAAFVGLALVGLAFLGLTAAALTGLFFVGDSTLVFLGEGFFSWLWSSSAFRFEGETTMGAGLAGDDGLVGDAAATFLVGDPATGDFFVGDLVGEDGLALEGETVGFEGDVAFEELLTGDVTVEASLDVVLTVGFLVVGDGAVAFVAERGDLRVVVIFLGFAGF